MYIYGKLVDTQIIPMPVIEVGKRDRSKINKMLKDFVESDKEYMEIINKSGTIYPVYKAYYNLKTCVNGWNQYVVAVLNGWPDVIGRLVKSFGNNAEVGDVVMKNEVMSENYSSLYEFIPLGYKIEEIVK